MTWDQRVYFARREADSLIKIGTSSNVRMRLRSLGGKHVLLGTVSGGRGLEEEFHKVFAAERAKGEWFRPSEDLLRLVESAKRGCDLEKPWAGCSVRRLLDKIAEARGLETWSIIRRRKDAAARAAERAEERRWQRLVEGARAGRRTCVQRLRDLREEWRSNLRKLEEQAAPWRDALRDTAFVDQRDVATLPLFAPARRLAVAPEPPQAPPQEAAHA